MTTPPQCSLCGEDMKRFLVDGETVWKCLNVNAHNAVQARKASHGGKKPGAGRKKKK